MFTKFNIANFEVENRSVRSATATATCDLKTGIPEQKFYDIYESLARGHVGLLIQEHSFVSLRGHAGHKQFGIHTDEMIQYHKKANDLMRAANDKIRICCQLAHAGPNGGAANKIQINEATAADFEEVVQQFKEAALRAKKAGYDCVQLHSGHTYLLSQTISDFYNKRTDEYKASDFKLLRDVLEAVRTVNIPVGIKLQCDDFIEGHSMNAVSACKIISALKFDFVEVTGGGQGVAKYSTIRAGKDQYYYRHVIQEFKAQNLLDKQPVIVTGGFENVEDAQMAFDDGVPLVGYSRKFLRNDQFLIDGDTKKCVRCNQCIGAIYKGQDAHCTISERERQK
ncbi:FAD/FMN_dependent oxidoreductase [Hexamita inflata]|uniref:FAD/FMN dependent oxidoreductase n=1 Tax=Hexamita inflata TaxID=28002 RepID=A0AA86V6U9_9EUKA|nr:FAD/FMN dependent oxidoreductase [Hexamita inflata]